MLNIPFSVGPNPNQTMAELDYKVCDNSLSISNGIQCTNIEIGSQSPHPLTCMCLQSWPRAGSWMRRKVIGHLRETLMAVCSTPSSPFSPGVPGMVPLLKFLLTGSRKVKINARGKMSNVMLFTQYKQRANWHDCGILLVTQCSAGRSLFFIRPCSTERTEGRWTSCSTNRWDWRGGENTFQT